MKTIWESHSFQVDQADRIRLPLRARVSCTVKDFAHWVSEYSGNISKGGMFVPTPHPPPRGTEVEFQFRMRDEESVIRGRGVVAWVRLKEDGPQRPCGMGIRFEEMDEKSRETLDRIVLELLLEGGTPFDLDERSPMDPQDGAGLELSSSQTFEL